MQFSPEERKRIEDELAQSKALGESLAARAPAIDPEWAEFCMAMRMCSAEFVGTGKYVDWSLYERRHTVIEDYLSGAHRGESKWLEPDPFNDDNILLNGSDFPFE